MTVGRICSRVVDTAMAEETVAAVAARMQARNVGSMPVFDDDGRLVGLVTDRDLVRVLAAGRDGSTTRVVEVMAETLQSIRADATIEDALAAMRQRRVRRLPVVDAADKLVGIVTLDDVLALLAEEFAVIGSVLAGSTEVSAGATLAPAAAAAPLLRHPYRPDGDRAALARLEPLLTSVRDALEAVACALAIGLPTRSLGGSVIEGDVRAAADRRLRAILDRG